MQSTAIALDEISRFSRNIVVNVMQLCLKLCLSYSNIGGSADFRDGSVYLHCKEALENMYVVTYFKTP
jgi:hypothetical protein